MNYSPGYLEIRCLKKGDVILVSTRKSELKFVVQRPLEDYSLLEMTEDNGEDETDPIPVFLGEIEIGKPLAVMKKGKQDPTFIGVPLAIDVFC